MAFPHLGDESVMIVEFKGEPPFSFTWTKFHNGKAQTFSETTIMDDKVNK